MKKSNVAKKSVKTVESKNEVVKQLAKVARKAAEKAKKEIEKMSIQKPVCKCECAKAGKKASILVEPTKEYTRAEARQILGLAKNTKLTEKAGYHGWQGLKTIVGSLVLEAATKSKKVKVGRKYASGKVQVLAR